MGITRRGFFKSLVTAFAAMIVPKSLVAAPDPIDTIRECALLLESFSVFGKPNRILVSAAEEIFPGDAVTVDENGRAKRWMPGDVLIGHADRAS